MLLTYSLAPKSSLTSPAAPLGPPGPWGPQGPLTYTYPSGSSWKQHVFYPCSISLPQYLKVGSGVGGLDPWEGARVWGFPFQSRIRTGL